MSDNFDPEDFYSNEDELMARADIWLEQLEEIASLMDMPDLFPSGWEDTVDEPDALFMQVSDENAEQFLNSLEKGI